MVVAGLAVVAGGLTAGLAMLWPTDQPERSRQVTQPELRTPNRPPEAAGAEAGPEGIPRLPNALPALAGQPGGPEGPAPLQVQDYLRLTVEAQCACRAREAADSAAELAHCRASTGAMNRDTDEATTQGIAAGRVVYDARAAAGCLREQQKCDAGKPAELCDRVFRGTVPLGGTCHFYAECAEGVCSIFAPERLASSGTCKPKPGVGIPCTDDGDCTGTDEILDCIDGTCRALPGRVGEHCSVVCVGGETWCDKAATPHVCKPALTKDAPCRPGANPPCGDALACVGDGRKFRCRDRAQGGPGQACDPSQGPYASCAFLQVCVATPQGGRCADSVDDDEECFGDAQCRFLKSYCARDSGSQAGRCVRLPVAGEACAPRPIEGGRCARPFLCDLARNVCVDKLAEGAACEGHLCELGRVPSLVCVHGVCRRPQPAGAPCEPEPEGPSTEGELRCARGLECVAGHCVKK